MYYIMIIISLHQSTAQVLERHIDDSFDINSKQIIKMDKTVIKLLNPKNHSWF